MQAYTFIDSFYQLEISTHSELRWHCCVGQPCGEWNDSASVCLYVCDTHSQCVCGRGSEWNNQRHYFERRLYCQYFRRRPHLNTSLKTLGTLPCSRSVDCDNARSNTIAPTRQTASFSLPASNPNSLSLTITLSTPIWDQPNPPHTPPNRRISKYVYSRTAGVASSI